MPNDTRIFFISWIPFIISLMPIIITSLVFGPMFRALAKEKDRNVRWWTILGFIPFINILCMPFIVGAANLRLENKIDALLKMMNENPRPSNMS